MAIKKTVEIDVEIVKAQGGLDAFTKNIQQADNATKSLKAQMIEAQKEVTELSEKFGATSREAINAAKKAAELKDKIGDAKSLTDAFNPDAKFKALSNSLTGVAGGFAAYQGALGLIGVESKETEEALLKVQSAMALASGAQAVGESVDSFKQLGAVVKSYTIVQRISTALQLAFNTAMAANPIGVIVAAIVGLIAAGYALVKMFQASSDAAEASATANKKLNQELQNQINIQKKATVESDLQRDSQLKMAKASGASSKEIRKLSEELANQEVKQKIANAETLKAIFLEARRVAGLEDATEAQKETAKTAFKAFQDANKIAEDAVLNRRKLAIENRVAERQEQTDANKKTQEEDAKHLKELQDKRNEARANEKKKAEEELKAFQALIAQKRQIELDSLNASRDAIDKATEENINRTLSESEVQERAIKDKYFTIIETARQNGQDILELEIAQANELNDVRLKDAERKAVEQKAIDDKEIADAKTVADTKIAIQQGALDALGGLVGLAKSIGEKNKGIQKAALVAETALGIANVILNTNVGSSKEVATKGIFGLTTSTILYAKMGISIASILAASAKGLQALGGGGSGASASGATGAGGGGGGSSAPQFNIVGQSSTNQLAQTIANQQKQPIKTYVVAGDVTTQQSLDRNAVQTSTFGG